MPKIVLDTNIIARALVSPHGLAAEIFQRVISNDHLLCTSGFMLAELDRVLRYPRFRKIHSLSDSEIEDFVRSVQRVEQATQVEDIKQPSTLEKAANLLSLPSSSVLDAATAKNPFDQWLDPFGKNINANRTTGRQALRSWGMAGPQDSWGNAIAIGCVGQHQFQLAKAT